MGVKKQIKQQGATKKAKKLKEKEQDEDSFATERGIPDVDFRKLLGCGG